MASTRSSIMIWSLPAVSVGEAVEVDVDGRVGERRHLRAGPDGADDEPRPVRRGELGGGLLRDADVEPVDLVELVAHAEFVEDDLRLR